MHISAEKYFLKELNLLDKTMKKRIEDFLIFTEEHEWQEIENIFQIKKLVGYQEYYRLRIGDYRVGIKKTENILKLVRVRHRKDIYRYFP